ncbi:hypothetical protein K469DRAFT_80916 [Zopfia rhizophila CBS 207.26]|uniref:C2H2-type domain-containing protein n=1 Tax=Zopfia rhizophila CBS 207.26 TaxID=1314779 RepID=A0A6A6D9F7_9PEZI|nr:hypothetical protein K469DRAFT_80916 [Zopfia rhizophila CBS 207.26]
MSNVNAKDLVGAEFLRQLETLGLDAPENDLACFQTSGHEFKPIQEGDIVLVESETSTSFITEPANTNEQGSLYSSQLPPLNNLQKNTFLNDQYIYQHSAKVNFPDAPWSALNLQASPRIPGSSPLSSVDMEAPYSSSMPSSGQDVNSSAHSMHSLACACLAQDNDVFHFDMSTASQSLTQINEECHETREEVYESPGFFQWLHVPNFSTQFPSSDEPELSDKSPLSCKYCGIEFAGVYGSDTSDDTCELNTAAIVAHLRVYCEAEPCEKSFRRKDARLKHYRKHHPEFCQPVGETGTRSRRTNREKFAPRRVD